MAEFFLDGIRYALSPELAENTALPTELCEAIHDWYEQKGISISTSGSTGDPKVIFHPHERLIASIEKTGAFFDLPAGKSALLCLPIDKIAGRMMLYRAFHLDWVLDIHPPSSTPFRASEKKYDFAALTPHQVASSLEDGEVLSARVAKLLIGGAPVTSVLEARLNADGVAAWESYGMTETVTHIAVRMVSPVAEPYFSCLDGVSVSTTDDDRLVIHADHLGEALTTTDIVELIDTHHFRWLGRADNVINSGGLKIHPEIIEPKVAHLLDRRFYISGRPDELFGQRVVLNIEGSDFRDSEEKELMERLREVVEKHEVPKEIIYHDHFTETSTGKIIRL